MGARALFVQYVVEVVLIAAIFLVLPRIARRGLLFGVYVGEERWDSTEARQVTTGWYVGMALVVAAGLAVFAVAAPALSAGAAFALASLALLVGAVAIYLRAHHAARRLAERRVAPAVAILEEEPPSASIAPLVTLGLVVLAVAGMVAQVAVRWPQLPERIPVHFNAAGEPDGWAAKSLAQVLLLPALTLVVGGFIGLMALMLLHAKRSLRHPGSERSAEAQRRFRVATSRFLCGITLFVTALLGSIHWGQMRTALGQAAGLGPWMIAWGFGIAAYSLGGVIYLMVRYGQGGARIEATRGAAAGSLTNGLADNRLWKWGLLYINREDPSIFVEKRFGLGYTVNLGNPRALALLGGFFLALGAIVLLTLF